MGYAFHVAGGDGEEIGDGVHGMSRYVIDEQGEWNGVTVALARLAEYSNTGGNRTGGFGETKLVDN